MAIHPRPVYIPAQPAGMQRSTSIPEPQGSVRIQYLERSPVSVREPVSGRQYDFSATNRVQKVDALDAPSLLQTKFFRRS
jgi:hypothetical protein